MKNMNDKALNEAAKRANIDINELKRASQNGNVDDFINRNLPPDASKKLKNILSNQAATEKLLSTPQAKELLNKLMNK